MAPTVVFVPGWWVGTSPYEKVMSILNEGGLKTEIKPLVSTGTLSPGNPSMKDDIASVAKHIESVLERDEDVFLVLHSAGGFLGGAATKGLLKKKGGSKAGVVGAAFISGAVFPEGMAHETPPFAIEKDGALYCADAGNLLYGDLPEPEKAKWVETLQTQPANGWNDTVTYTPWSEIPSVYIIGEKDNALPPPLQEQLAGISGSKIEKVPGGHMSMVSVPQDVAKIIQAAVAA